MRTVSLLFVAASLISCNEFRKAERRIDHPNGKVSNTAGVQSSVQQGSLQSNTSGILADTTGSIAVPFASTVTPRTGLDDLLATPEIQEKMPFAKTVENINRMVRAQMVQDGTPFALNVTNTGTINPLGCEGSIDFTVAEDLNDSGLAGTVEVTAVFNQVICPEGSIDGTYAFQAEFNALLAKLKIINIVQAEVSDTVDTATVDFAFRLDTALLEALSLDMSVAIDEESYTLSIDGDLTTGTATLTVVGKDGELTCDVSSGIANCQGIAQFNL